MIDFQRSKGKFKPHEWPGGPDTIDLMHPDLFYCGLFPLRLIFGHTVHPSQDVGAHIRPGGTGEHRITKDHPLSEATDCFVANAHVADLIRARWKVPDIGGFGLYFDTLNADEQTLFHIDMRPEPLWWVRVDGSYIYEPNDPAYFYRVLSEQLTGVLNHG